MSKLGNFIDAFRIGGVGETETCTCGEEHEEARRIAFNGCEYVLECDCWQEKAENMMKFLDTHAIGIAEYLNAERERKIEEANRVKPIVLDNK